MSIAYDSGGRHRPVDVSADDGDEIVINGTRLKQERVERGLSVSDAARMVTLSREQVEQIENGGLGAFYGARHKLLAARKYAEGFGISLEELMPPPPPPSAPASASVPALALAPEAEAAVMPAEAASGDNEPVEPVVVQTLVNAEPATTMARNAADGDVSSSSGLSEETVKRLPLALVVGVALVLAFSILRGLTPTSTQTELPPPEPAAADAPASSVPVESSQTDVQTAAAQMTVTPDVVTPSPTATSVQAAAPAAPVATPAPAAVATPSQAQATPSAIPAPREAAAADSCALTAGPDTPRWAPPQARVANTRLFLTSVAPIEVCVTDAAGVATLLKLKPGAMSSAAGKPPYIVRSERLTQAQIFLQGLKVRVPASATAVHLITTQSVRPPESPAATEQ